MRSTCPSEASLVQGQHQRFMSLFAPSRMNVFNSLRLAAFKDHLMALKKTSVWGSHACGHEAGLVIDFVIGDQRPCM